MPHDPDAWTQRTRRLALAFGAITALTYCLIVLGALVRAHGAGLACPDWPLCFGEAIPRFDLRVAFEWSHRVVAGGISLLFAGASFAALRDPRLRPSLWLPIGITAAILGVQILLGALTVWHLLASWTVTSHLLVGNAFGLGLAFITRRLLRESSPPPDHPPVAPEPRAWVTAASALLLLQMALGGLVSSGYAGLACSEWPTCNAGVWIPGFEGALGLHLAHRFVGYSLLFVLAVATWRTRGVPGLERWVAIAVGVAALQVAAGVANVLLRLPVEVTGLHSALAAGLVLTVALAVAEAWRTPVAQRTAPALA